MARTAADSTSDHLYNSSYSALVTPLTLSCWFYPPNTNSRVLVGVGQYSSNDQRWTLGTDGSAHVNVLARTTTNGSAATSTTYSANGWYHACGVFGGTASRDVFLNGAGKGSDTTSIGPSAAGALVIHGNMGLGTARLGGGIAEVAVWSVALSDAEVLMLARGVSPRHIQRANLVSYCPLFGGSPEPDYSGNGYNLTLSGTSISDHAPVGPLFGYDRQVWTTGYTPPAGGTVGAGLLYSQKLHRLRLVG